MSEDQKEKPAIFNGRHVTASGMIDPHTSSEVNDEIDRLSRENERLILLAADAFTYYRDLMGRIVDGYLVH